MIERNGLLPADSAQLELQDASSLLDTLPAGHTVPDRVTDAAATFDRVLHGDGISHRQKIRTALFSH
jgi:hypothetical protein